MPLHISYRPQSLDEVYGNEKIKDSLQSVLSRKKDKPKAFLFHGPSGCGKTTMARIIGNMLNCAKSDFYEYNASNTRGIDTIREIVDQAGYLPMMGPVKVFLLDEAHKLTNDAQNAMLKLLEDTPAHVYIILCTTEPEKIIKTVHNRCTSYEVQPLFENQIRQLILDILVSEEVKGFPDTIVQEIVKAAEGCPRRALLILDSVIDIPDDDKAMEAVQAFSAAEAVAIDICRLLTSNNPAKWSSMRGLILNLNDEPERVRRAILGYLQAILLKRDKGAEKYADMMFFFLDNSVMYSGKPALSWALFKACQI